MPITETEPCRGKILRLMDQAFKEFFHTVDAEIEAEIEAACRAYAVRRLPNLAGDVDLSCGQIRKPSDRGIIHEVAAELRREATRIEKGEL